MFKRCMFTIALFSAVSSVQASDVIYFGEYADFGEYAPQLPQDIKKGADAAISFALQAQQKAAQGYNSLTEGMQKAVQSWKDSTTSFIDTEKTLQLSNYPACTQNVAEKYQSWKDNATSFIDTEKSLSLSDYPACDKYVNQKVQSWKDGAASFNEKFDVEGSISSNDYIGKAVQAQEVAWYNKIWNANIAGYEGAGKYVIVGSAVVVGAVVAAYYAGFFSKKATTIEAQIEALILQAQANPNIIIVELPKILATCDNEQVRFELFQFVLSNVEITPEIQQAFEL